jgi:hypothetical protein
LNNERYIEESIRGGEEERCVGNIRQVAPVDHRRGTEEDGAEISKT